MTEMDDKKHEKAQDLTIDELALAFSMPAPVSDKFVVTLGNAGVRLSFLEQGLAGLPLVPRNAITLSFTDSVQLYKVLQNLLKEFEFAVEAMKDKSSQKNGEN